MSILSLFESSGPLPGHVWKPLETNPLPYAGLLSSLREEHDYRAEVEGVLPSDLRGTLYRNGPGLFDRSNGRKRMTLDGDGMIQAIEIKEGNVRFRNRFVRTQKYIEENARDEFLYSTWSTLAPGGPLVNAGGRALRNQAGVTVIRRGEQLLAFDEGYSPYEMDPVTLDTLGTTSLGVSEGFTNVQAHFKVNGRNGDLHLFGIEHGTKPNLHLTTFDSVGNVKHRSAVPMPRYTYIHDWAVTERYAVFILHPAIVSGMGALLFLGGFKSIVDILQWSPEKGNLICVIDRDRPEAPILFEGPTSWMWHTLNAYERKNEIIVDFVGSEPKAGLGDKESPHYLAMKGIHPKKEGAKSKLRRYILNLTSRQLTEEILSDEDSYEMPNVNPNVSCLPYRFGYLARKGSADFLWSSIAKIDIQTGKLNYFDFGKGKYCVEPVFVPKKNGKISGKINGLEDSDAGYLLTEVFDSFTKKSFLAILNAEQIEQGPVAVVKFKHHVPLSFHGTWF